ncbi:histidine phosphatase family protein [Acetobacter ghanensis]|uniref:histidine phosphatase family protein n=1 Tax=Acetobacter ghanensis TaxID=431306 RepID=UPI003D3509D6
MLANVASLTKGTRAGKVGVLKLLCCASDLPSAVRRGYLPSVGEQVTCPFDMQKVADFLPSCSQLTLYCAPDVALPDVGGHQLLIVESLRDRNYGTWAGTALQDIAPAEQLSFLSDALFSPPEGESFAACYQRTAQWLRDLEQVASAAVVLARPSIVRNLILQVLYAGDGVVGMGHAARLDVSPRSYSLLTGHAGRWRVGMVASPA